MDKKVKTIVNIVLVALLAVCVAKAIKTAVEDRAGKKDYEQASMLATGLLLDTDEEPTGETAGEPPAPSEPEPQATEPVPIPDDPVIHRLLELDLEALRQENEDVIGWITIPDTVLDYPLLHWTDNEFYLTHTWKQTPNPNGAIFMESQNSPDLTDFNTIIYGHNMNSGLMFGTLRNYRTQTYWEEHPRFYILCDRGVLRYDIFAVHRAGVDTIVYGLELDTSEKRTRFLRFSQDYSAYDTGIRPGVDDAVVTLSTCSGQGYTNRWVVQGVLNVAGSYQPGG